MKSHGRYPIWTLCAVVILGLAAVPACGGEEDESAPQASASADPGQSEATTTEAETTTTKAETTTTKAETTTTALASGPTDAAAEEALSRAFGSGALCFDFVINPQKAWDSALWLQSGLETMFTESQFYAFMDKLCVREREIVNEAVG